MSMPRYTATEIATQIQTRLSANERIEEIIADLFERLHVGKLMLIKPVSQVLNVPRIDAMKLIVTSTAPSCPPE